MPTLSAVFSGWQSSAGSSLKQDFVLLRLCRASLSAATLPDPTLPPPVPTSETECRGRQGDFCWLQVDNLQVGVAVEA
jgi:hypothetical protein